MNEKKTWKVHIKEIFTKTRDERYAESTKNEKKFYWIFISIGWLTILLLCIFY